MSLASDHTLKAIQVLRVNILALETGLQDSIPVKAQSAVIGRRKDLLD